MTPRLAALVALALGAVAVMAATLVGANAETLDAIVHPPPLIRAALVGASAAIAAAIGPLVGGFITTFLSWRVGFMLEVVTYEQVDDADLIDPSFQGPPFWFQQMDAPRPQRNRIHVDVYLPVDQAEARVAAALAAGGHLVSDENAPEWWTLADAEGNEVDVAPWPDRG